MAEHEHAHPSDRLYLAVWAGLIALTGLTVCASYLDMKHVAIFTCLLIASTKATIVTMYFMHIRFQKPIYTAMIAAALVTYAIFVALTFSDYAFR